MGYVNIIFRYMKEFYKLSLELYSQANISFGTDDFANVNLPKLSAYIVNASFACELAIKGIIDEETNGKVEKRHSLYELFMALNGNTQEQIMKLMPNYCLENYHLEFENELNRISDNFVEWRYFYEGNQKTNVLFLRDFLDVLVEYIKEKYGDI